jgi:hypothetical protein
MKPWLWIRIASVAMLLFSEALWTAMVQRERRRDERQRSSQS